MYYVSQLYSLFPFRIPTWVGSPMAPKLACAFYIGHQGPFNVGCFLVVQCYIGCRIVNNLQVCKYS